jgi:hypothetical protein
MGIAIGVCAVSCLCLVAMMLLAYQRRADEEYDDLNDDLNDGLNDDVEFADEQADLAAAEEDVVFEPAYVREEDRVRPAVSAVGELIWVDEDELVWHEIVAWTGLTEDSSPMHRVLGA